MFCQACGTPNDDAALFCESCGARLEKKKTGKIISKEHIILFSEIVILCILIVVFYSVGELSCSPENVAERYFVNVVNGNWEKVFQELDIEETPFINAERLSDADINRIFENINNYSVAQNTLDRELWNELTNTDLGTVVTINYRLKGMDYDNRYEIPLNKQIDKKYLFFDDWKVGTGNLVCQNFSVYVPDGAKVMVDGIPLDDTYLRETEEDERQHYVIPQLFFGMHAIHVERPDWGEVDEEISVTYSNEEYYLRNMQLTEDALSRLSQLAVDDMQQIYRAALGGEAFHKIAAIFTPEESYRESIAYDYNELVSYMNQSEDLIFKQINFSEIRASAETDEAIIRIDFNYQMDYSRKSWRSDGWEDGQYQGNGSCYFDFVKEENQWVLQNLGCKELYY